MGVDTDRLRSVVAAIVRPFRLVGRAVGVLVAVVLLVSVPVVLVATLTFAWFVPALVVEAAVGLPLEPVGLLARIGLPARMAGVPMLYPLGMAVLTSLVLGWPSPDLDTDLGDGLFRRT